MHRITAAAIADVSRPEGHSQLHCGMIACSPAVPVKTRTSAMMLTTMSTPNWIAMSTFWMRSDSTMPRALISVMAMMKKQPSSTLAVSDSASESRPRNLYR